jgi:hypothetical protein
VAYCSSQESNETSPGSADTGAPDHDLNGARRCEEHEERCPPSRSSRLRGGYRVSSCRAALLSYNITHNHVHLTAFAEDSTAVAIMMQQAAGEFARDYNRRKKRSGAFWEGRLVGAQSIEQFREHLMRGLNERIEKRQLERQARWTEALAVGSQSFVEAMERRVHHRQRLETEADGGMWVLREAHGPVFGPEK